MTELIKKQLGASYVLGALLHSAKKLKVHDVTSCFAILLIFL